MVARRLDPAARMSWSKPLVAHSQSTRARASIDPVFHKTKGQPPGWVLAGEPGFIHSLDSRRLRIEGMAALADPPRANLAIDGPVGLLGIDFATRRRVRVNGTVAQIDSSGFAVRVQQSYGNCPQYIQARKPRFVAPVPMLARSAPEFAVTARCDGFMGRRCRS